MLPCQPCQYYMIFSECGDQLLDSNRLYRRDTDILYTPRSCLLHKPPVGDTEISCVNHEQESLTAIEYHDIHIMDLSGSAYYFDTLKQLTKIKYMIF